MAMAAHVSDTLTLLLPQFQGRTVTEAGVDGLLDTLLQGLVAWQLAHSEPWGEAEDARRLSVEVLARAVVGQAVATAVRPSQVGRWSPNPRRRGARQPIGIPRSWPRNPACTEKQG